MPPFPWQNSVWQSFIRQVENGVLPHALLVGGGDGIGVEKLGAAMAHYLLCRSPMEGVACGGCKACLLIRAGSHPDLVEIEAEGKGKAIKVDQIRSLTAFVSKTSQQGGRKLVIINPAESMNLNAANSLLKCLEEPAGDTVLILLSLEPSRLMPTIRSRCSKVSVLPPSNADSIAWLSELGVEEPQTLLDECGQAPLLALEWWHNDYFQQRIKMCESLVALSEGAVSVGTVVQSWSSYSALDVINATLTWLDRLIRERVSSDGNAQKRASEVWASLRDATAAIPETLLFRFRDALCQRKAHIQRNSNLNSTLILEELLMDWKAMIRHSSRLLRVPTGD